MNSLILVFAAGLLLAGVGASQEEQLYGIGRIQKRELKNNAPSDGIKKREPATGRKRFYPKGPYKNITFGNLTHTPDLTKITAAAYADSYPDNLAAAIEYVSNEGGIPYYDAIYGEEREAFITLNGCKYENVLYDGEIISIKPSTSFDYCKETCKDDCTHFTFYYAEQCALFKTIKYGRHSTHTADSGRIDCM